MSTDDPFADLEDLEPPGPPGGADESGPTTQDELAARIEYLRAENQQLRAEYTRARRSQYRRTAVGLVAVGAVAAIGGLLFDDTRQVLFALAGIGAFAGLLTLYLTPEQFIPADVGERIYGALATNEAAIVADLGLTDARVYVPSGASAESGVRLFVPQHDDYERPPGSALDAPFVVTDDDRQRGLSLRPTGGALYEEFERAAAGQPADDPAALTAQLADSLVEQFELLDAATADVDAADGRASVAVEGSRYGDLSQFDHPVPSLLAVGLATALGRSVVVGVDRPDDDRMDALVSLVWTPEDAEGGASVQEPTGDADGSSTS